MFAIGDPQAPFERFQAAIAGHSGHLISVGDHFDFHPKHAANPGAEGVRILTWLAEHDTTILAGNHDLVRVMELAVFDDRTFAEARDAGDATFAQRYPNVPTKGVVTRDFSSYSVEQRALVQRLLLTKRMRMATAAELHDGTPVLITHAGVTQPILDELSLGNERDVHLLAQGLNAWLDAQVERVRAQWERGEAAPLELPLPHRKSAPGIEAGGPFYHRPSLVDGAPGTWHARSFEPQIRRRYRPNELPRGLVQVCGHTTDKKCVEELGLDRKPITGRIRALTPDDYGLGVGEGDTRLILIDGALSESDGYELLPLRAAPPRP